MQTSENPQALGKIIDFTRLVSILLLFIHFYCTCYTTFQQLHLTATIVDNVVFNLVTGMKPLSPGFIKSSALLLLTVALIGNKGKKDEKQTIKPIIILLISGLILYYSATFILSLSLTDQTQASLYISITATGYLLVLTAGNKISRVIHIKLNNDPFNSLNETFPQEERWIENEFSVNMRTEYNLKGKIRSGVCNILQPQRATLLCGTPGSGKSVYLVRAFIEQHLAKAFTMFVFDYKFPDLSKITYNHLLKNIHKYKIPPHFCVINFDDLSRTHRCNAIPPQQMTDITDATESSRTIMLALNRLWIQRQGDFFTESPINFVTALFWFLKKYQGGIYCTLPHTIELSSVAYPELFAVMEQEEEIQILMNPFYSAWKAGAAEQLEGQIASAKIGLSRLASPQLYYVLSGNDFTLDINNPESPKVVVMGSNPQRQAIYGAVLSLYAERLLKQINKPGKLKSSVIIDEAPTIYIGGLDNHIAVARGRGCCTTLAIQDLSQFRRDYGKEQADVIVNTCGNIILYRVRYWETAPSFYLNGSGKLCRTGNLSQSTRTILPSATQLN
ncbi:TraM recognition site of TraD and TraG [Filimonas lacunae]|uniref:TraM recognition site of TraD and TraG n=1 Tax=Filimonas lacunae TaxID=477680 RepID=A0A173MAC0_9BACT|nr:YWFCY domain-containing protein [Filimonas lacunae]BAV04459.1 mobilization protein BF0133 [Filimonas lacunae]SIT31484.1 TraM recognition site of TraD and TraG [Filimonas lacunae]